VRFSEAFCFDAHCELEKKPKCFHIEVLYLFECCLFEHCCFLPLCLEELLEFLAFCFLFPKGEVLVGSLSEVAWWF